VGGQDVYRGFEFYDGPLMVRRTVFWGFSGRGSIPWSALGFNRFVNGVNVDHEAEDLQFINSRRFYLDVPLRGHDGERNAAFRDVSGSLTGTPGAWITANNPFITVPECQSRPDWNAAICPGPYLRVHLNSEYGRGFAPLRVTRDDGVALDLHGGFSPDHSSVTMMPGRRYDYELAQAPGGLNIYLHSAKVGDWVILSLPMKGATPDFLLNHGQERVYSAASIWDLENGDKTSFWHDAKNERLHLRLEASNPPRSWAQVNLFVNISDLGSGGR